MKRGVKYFNDPKTCFRAAEKKYSNFELSGYFGLSLNDGFYF